MKLPDEIINIIINNKLNIYASKIQRWWMNFYCKKVHQCITTHIFKSSYLRKKLIEFNF